MRLPKRRKIILGVCITTCVLAVLMISSVLALKPANAQLSHSRWYVHEFTTSSMIGDVHNLSSGTIDVVFDIYNADGSDKTTKTLTLRGYENKTIQWENTENLSTCGASLLCGFGMSGDTVSEGSPGDGNTTAYGVHAHSDDPFNLIVYSDNLEFGAESTINPQGELYTDTWFGMYNYPSSSDSDKDYFHVFNGNDTATTISVDVYKYNGFHHDANGGTAGKTYTLTLDKWETRKIFPQDDFGLVVLGRRFGINTAHPVQLSSQTLDGFLYILR